MYFSFFYNTEVSSNTLLNRKSRGFAGWGGGGGGGGGGDGSKQTTSIKEIFSGNIQ